MKWKHWFLGLVVLEILSLGYNFANWDYIKILPGKGLVSVEGGIILILGCWLLCVGLSFVIEKVKLDKTIPQSVLK